MRKILDTTKAAHLASLAFFVVMILTCGHVCAATYYVSPSGNDVCPGTIDSPWRTIQHAADTMAGGDYAYIRGGIYYEGVETRRDGSTSAGHIVFSAYPSETPIIDGTDVTTGNNGFTIAHSYITLNGLTIRHWNDTGIWMWNAAHVELNDCVVHEVPYGIGAANGTHDFVLNRIQIHHFDLFGFDASPAEGNNCYNGTLNDCIAHTARDHEQNADGFALGHGTQNGFTFNRCSAYDVYDGFDISAPGTILSRCSAHDCWNTGYKVWTDRVDLINCIGYHNTTNNLELDWDEEPGTTTVINCTFMDSETWNIWVENRNDSLHMYNTILAGGDNIGLGFEEYTANNYRGDYNLFHNDNGGGRAITVGYVDEFSLNDINNGSWTTYSGQDEHSLIASTAGAIFVDADNFDLHLNPSSPAIDTGRTVDAPLIDFGGTARPQGTGYDIGGYEFRPPPFILPSIYPLLF